MDGLGVLFLVDLRDIPPYIKLSTPRPQEMHIFFHIIVAFWNNFKVVLKAFFAEGPWIGVIITPPEGGIPTQKANLNDGYFEDK